MLGGVAGNKLQEIKKIIQAYKSMVRILLLLLIIIVSSVVYTRIRSEKNLPDRAQVLTINSATAFPSPVLTPNPSPVIPSEISTADFRFSRLPFDAKDIGSVTPVGEFGGITRKDAQNSHFYGNYRHYIFSKSPGVYAYNVYAPAAGEIVGFRNSDVTGQYRFNFKINSKAFYYLDHIQSLSPEILEKLKLQFGSPPRVTQGVESFSPGISIKAGDVLGQTGLKGIAWDWGVIDSGYCQDIIHPEHYAQDQCPRSAYDFFTDEMKTQVASLAGYWAAPPAGNGLNKVAVEPVLGQYAHDQKGTLAGGWMQEEKSWKNAFFVPDSYKPQSLSIRLAIPTLSVFGVWNGIAIGTGKTNPDPATVTTQSGIVGYVLEKVRARDTTEYGVVLVRVNPDDTISVETLSKATRVPANPQFSSAAVTLGR